MKIASIVGARPQFVKASALSGVLRVAHEEVLIHTGQHYDFKMSRVFFEELDIPEPDVNLNVGSASHAKQTSEMLVGIEHVLLGNNFDAVLVYGDTNSTAAGALAAAKLHIPIGHIEAGLRSFNRRMPEEINRVVADHVSNWLFCPTSTAANNLKHEGLTESVHIVGDVMLDALRAQLGKGLPIERVMHAHGLRPGQYALATLHRAENTDDPTRLQAILQGLAAVPDRVLLPLHPRTRSAVQRLAIQLDEAKIRLVEPFSFAEMVAAEKYARVIVTDSGGVQKEACWLGVPCVTVRDETEWLETVESGWNVLVGADPLRLVKAVQCARIPEAAPGKGLGPEGASQRIRSVLEDSA